MTNAQQAALTNYAKSDLRKARNKGGILIAQTLRGTVELTYAADTKSYSVVSLDGGTFQKSGTAKEMVAVIAGLYDVVAQ
jgi:hypothetical protein